MLRFPGWWIGCAAAATIIAALWLVYVFPPTEYHFFPKCLFYQWTGLYCPGCGGTRAAHHLVHGRFLDALSMNALAVILLPCLFLTLAIQKIRNPKKPVLDLTISSRMGWGLASLVLGFGFLRNIPLMPFSYLAPKTAPTAQTNLTPSHPEP